MTQLVAIEKKKFPNLRKRTIPVEWEKWVEDFSPPTNRFQWLKLIHEEGYPWEPIDRFIIYLMVPARFVMDEVLEQLQHPLPPSEMGNYYDHALGEFVRNPDCLITERAWKLYRETECWGKPYWVIQGNHGGHKRWFSPIEKKLLKLAGLPSEPPEVGSLAFAEFDQRVKDQLTAQDLLKSVHARLKGSKQQMVAQTALRQERQEREFREGLTKWLFAQVAEIAPDVHKGLIESDAPRSDFDVKEMERLSEEAEAAFIETGRTDGLIRIAR